MGAPSKKTFGVIGFGQMGQLMARELARVGEVLAWDPRPEAGAGLRPGPVQRAELEQAAACDLVFLFPPIAQIGACCQLIREHVTPGALIIEGCSVMCFPVAAMREHLPASVELAGCHPLFGPQSAARGAAGFKMVLAPVRTTRLDELAHLLAGLGLEVLVTTPEEHDRAMARTQALEQLIGRILLRLDVRDEPIDVPGYKKLVELRRMLEHDSDDLFRAIQRHNPFASHLRERFAATLRELMRELDGDQP